MKFLAGHTRVLPRTFGSLVQNDSKARLPKDNVRAIGPYIERNLSKREVSTTSTNLFKGSQSSRDL